MKVIKFEQSDYNRCNVDELDATHNHVEGNINDYTLCGFTLDMDAPYDYIEGKITCPHCIAIIDLSKGIKEKDIGRKNG